MQVDFCGRLDLRVSAQKCATSFSQNQLAEGSGRDLRAKSASNNSQCKFASNNSQIFLLSAPVTQTDVTSSRKLGITIRKMFCKLDSRGFPKTCRSTPNSIRGERYGFRKIGLLHTPSQFQLFFLLFAFKPSL